MTNQETDMTTIINQLTKEYQPLRNARCSLDNEAGATRFKIDEEGFTKDLDYIKAMIRFEIDNALFGVADARRHLIGVDPQAQLALQQFGEAQKLVELTRGTGKAGH